MIRTCGDKLPQQPYRCYNCQHRRQTKTSRPSTPRMISCSPLSTIVDSEGMDEPSAIAAIRRAQSFPVTAPVYHPLPNVANQPRGCVQPALQKRLSSGKSFKFSCQSSSHVMSPHYFGLPSHLPHQDHPCAPCQLQDMRTMGEANVVRQARKEYPSLTMESLIRAGCIREFQAKPTWEQYADEKTTEEREMWFHVTRKWTQDLRRCRVLVAEEDGMGLLQ